MKRVHLVDCTTGGALLLELFTRDGVGTMIARLLSHKFIFFLSFSNLWNESFFSVSLHFFIIIIKNIQVLE